MTVEKVTSVAAFPGLQQTCDNRALHTWNFTGSTVTLGTVFWDALSPCKTVKVINEVLMDIFHTGDRDTASCLHISRKVKTPFKNSCKLYWTYFDNVKIFETV